MDCKSLMIGDLVTLNYEGVKKAVVTHRLHQHLCDVLTDCGNHIDSVPYSMLEPIPLTEEMLEANGWELDGYYWIHKDVCFEINDESLTIYELPIKLNYVHQLQQALRLCGLSDLADNFKME